MKVLDKISGKLVDSHIYNTVESLIKTYKTKSLWTVITALIEAWEKLHPTKYEAYLVSFKEARETRRNRFASTRDKSLRYMLDIPYDVLKLIRVLYPADVLPMDKRFFREFARRFPKYRVPEKL